MRRILFGTSLLLLVVACKKKETETARSGPNVGSAALSQQFTAGSSLYFNYYYTGVNGTTATSGTDQTWNYSSLTNPVADTLRAGAASNSTFSSATYTRSQTVNYGIGGNTQPLLITTYYEVSNNGWFELGRSMPAFGFTVPATATVNFPAQSNAYTPNKLALTPALPAYYGDSVAFNSVIQESGTANAPAYLLSNAPVTQKTTFAGSTKVAGTGTLRTPGSTTSINAIMIRRAMSRTTNFLLNGTTPPAILLSTLGITDGQVTQVVAYDFYGQGNEGFLGSIYTEGGVTRNAYFRRN